VHQTKKKMGVGRRGKKSLSVILVAETAFGAWQRVVIAAGSPPATYKNNNKKIPCMMLT